MEKDGEGPAGGLSWVRLEAYKIRLEAYRVRPARYLVLLRRICNKPLCAQKHTIICRCRFMRQNAYASTVICDITLSLFVICR